MTRKSKPARRRARYPRKRIAAILKARAPTAKSPPPFKEAVNAVHHSPKICTFIPLIGSI